MAALLLALSEEDRILKEFLDKGTQGLAEEDVRIAEAGSQIHWRASGIHLAEYETAYAYLLKRSLVSQSFPYRIDNEVSYPNVPSWHADLTISHTILDRNQTIWIEMKLVFDKKVDSNVREDVAKLQSLKAGEFDRKCLLLFPMAVWKAPEIGPIDANEYARLLTGDCLSVTPRVLEGPSFKTRVRGQDFKNEQKVDFRLVLLDITPVEKSAP